MTTVNSAYPPAIDDLLPQARDLATRLGQVPSRNRLKKELRVGAPKANALRDALAAADAPQKLTRDTHTYHLIRGGIADPPADLAGPAGAPGPALAPTPEPTPAPEPAPDSVPDPAPADVPVVADASAQVTTDADPDSNITHAPVRQSRRPVAWPVLLLAAPAFVAIWAGWVDLGRLTGFGPVNLLPGITDRAVIDTAITLPVGMETYAAYALWVWLSGRAPRTARRFAKSSAIGALVVGAAGQIAYHLMTSAGWTTAPLLVTALVACLPVAVLGMGAALAHLLHTDA